MKILSAPPSGYPGVTLRQLERSDAPSWYAYLSKPEVVRHTSWNLQSDSDLLLMFDALDSELPSSIRRLAIVDDDAGQLIGTIGFHTVSDVNRTAEIAYDLAPEHWGRGIASAVCASVTAWSFSAFGFIRVQATVLETNLRSARVLEKCRYRHEGLLRSYRMIRGVPGNFQLYARLNDD
ncbi:N-acetyltransferase [Trinickia dabaoshanensis]|uniref:N-acetyltransferase n=1 Tax=Trinickia dabaoshanensis TaxID=564714 RepID=A0A2N7VEZ1_9BURK|nr:GNAT family protein [Trinickia dabaoshanensis]PMS15723.1 N-acetyltransferase [Trinickia dabaoshanensis]